MIVSTRKWNGRMSGNVIFYLDALLNFIAILNVLQFRIW